MTVRRLLSVYKRRRTELQQKLYKLSRQPISNLLHLTISSIGHHPHQISSITRGHQRVRGQLSSLLPELTGEITLLTRGWRRNDQESDQAR